MGKQQKIVNNIYDNSIKITESLAKILYKYGYEQKVKENQDLFCSVSLMFCFYFFEQTLDRYYNYDVDKRFPIIVKLIEELSTHINGVSTKLAFETYLELQRTLNDPPSENLEEFVSITFLMFSIQFEEEEVETWLLLDIYGEFHKILKNEYKII